jgi:hypothetical protein
MKLTYEKFTAVLCSYFEIKETKFKHVIVLKWIKANIASDKLEPLLNTILTHCRFFPTIAEIKQYIGLGDEDKAILIANKVIESVINNQTVDGIARKVLRSMGGFNTLNWQYQQGELNTSILHTQSVKIAKALLKESDINNGNNVIEYIDLEKGEIYEQTKLN